MIVPTVAFAYMTPEALRVFLQLAGFRVSVFDGSDESLDLREDKPSSNVVILPNFAKRGKLAPHADMIGSLVVLTNGRHEDLVELDIPILDSVVDGESIRQARDRTPTYYTKKIREAGVPLELTAPVTLPSVPEEVPTEPPKTLDQWFDALDQVYPGLGSFDHDVEYPVCQFVLGQLSQTELKSALKVLVDQGADAETLKQFYQWLVQRGKRLTNALKSYLLAAAPITATEVAKKFKVDAADVVLLENIYVEMQETEEGDVEDV